MLSVARDGGEPLSFSHDSAENGRWSCQGNSKRRAMTSGLYAGREGMASRRGEISCVQGDGRHGER